VGPRVGPDRSRKPDDGYDVAETCRQYKVCIKVY
jgi:hypothetical protein